MVSIALSTSLIGLVIGLQTFWMSRALGRLEVGVDTSGRRLGDFRAEMHRDVAAQTEAIVDLRERVTRLETT